MITNCQRCDKDLRIADGEKSDWVPDSEDNKLEGVFSFTGVYGSLKYDYERWEAELCESCCVELRDWIDAGPGKGVFKFDYSKAQWEATQRAGLAAIPTHPSIEGFDLVQEKLEEVLGELLYEFLEKS